MFKRFTLFALLLVCATSQIKSQSLAVGQYANVLLDSFTYWGGNCAPQFDFQLFPDSVFMPVATGVDLYAVVTEVNTNMPNSLLSSYGVVATGDTLPFDTTHTYPFTFYSGGYVKIEYRAIGTPTIVGEGYHCSSELGLTLANCGNAAYLWPISPTPDCQVQPMNAIENPLGKGWELYPVPVREAFRLRHVDGLTTWTEVKLRDVQGRVLRRWKEGEMMMGNGLPPGVYLLEIDSPEGRSVKRFLIE